MALGDNHSALPMPQMAWLIHAGAAAVGGAAALNGRLWNFFFSVRLGIECSSPR